MTPFYMMEYNGEMIIVQYSEWEHPYVKELKHRTVIVGSIYPDVLEQQLIDMAKLWIINQKFYEGKL